MSLIDRYIGRSVLMGTLLAMAVLLTLLGVLTLVDELEDVGTGSYSTSDAFLVSLLTLPRFAFEVFPVSALLGSLLGLGALASGSELTAMRAAGISLRRIVMAVMKTGLAMMLVAFIVGELIAPAAEQYAQQRRTERQQEQITLKTRYGFWARDGQAFINIREILPGNRLADIYIYEFDERRQLNLATHASSARFEDGRWVLEDIHQSRVSEEGVVSRQVERATWSSLLDPGLLSAVVVEPGMLPIWGLMNYIRFMHANGQSAIPYEVALWGKLATPLASLVMLFLAVPFVLGSLRSVGIGQRVFTGAIVGTGFYLLNRSFAYMAVVYELNALVSVALPLLLVLGIGVVMARRVG